VSSAFSCSCSSTARFSSYSSIVFLSGFRIANSGLAILGYYGLIYATRFGLVYASDFGSKRASLII